LHHVCKCRPVSLKFGAGNTKEICFTLCYGLNCFGTLFSLKVHGLVEIKGWTRASVIALILIACTELDHCDPATADKLKPLHKVLDKCWALPCHVFWLHNNGMNIFDLIICDIFFRVFILC
jgi:hypothetical protein